MSDQKLSGRLNEGRMRISAVNEKWLEGRTKDALALEEEVSRLQSEQDRLIREVADSLGVGIGDIKAWAFGFAHSPKSAKIQRVIDAFDGARAYKDTKAELTRLQCTPPGAVDDFEGPEVDIIGGMLRKMLKVRGNLPVGSGGDPAKHIGLAVQCLTLALDNVYEPEAKDAVSRALWRAAIALEGM